MYFFSALIIYIIVMHLKMNESLGRETLEGANVLIILGAKMPGGQITPMLKSRLDKGFELWESNQKLKVIVSGGGADEATGAEAQVMHDYLLERGMDPQCIFMESKSLTTYENLRNCRGMSSGPCIIVSSEFHAIRTAFLASRLGLKARVIGAKSPAGKRLKEEAREHLAIIKSWLWDKEPRR
ncbi:MAG: YdcF family protein [Turicibacter sp.]|nr:YdcF family protein [Turicibacter sp.]